MTSFRPCRLPLLVAATLVLSTASLLAQTPGQQPPQRTWLQRFLGIKPDLSGGWLFVGFKGDSRDGLYFEVSKDGSLWQPVNFDKPVLWQEQRGELMRDPFLQRAPDGSVRLVWTWSMDPGIIGYSTSSNLIYWSKQLQLPVTQILPAAKVSSPATYYDPGRKDWLLLFAASDTGSPAQDHLYATTTTDFKRFEPAKPFVDKLPGSDATAKTTFPAGFNHGSFLHLETPEYNLLHDYHRSLDDSAGSK